jgi:hypothetical protein
MNVTLKQYQFASIGYASETAFQAANAGMECALFHDYELYPDSKFDIGELSPNLDCMGEVNTPSVGDDSGSGWVSRKYRFSWGIPDGGTPEICTEIEIFKYYDATNPVDMTDSLRRSGSCPAGVTCTVIQSRGYNVACPGGGMFPPRTIERELLQRY